MTLLHPPCIIDDYSTGMCVCVFLSSLPIRSPMSVLRLYCVLRKRGVEKRDEKGGVGGLEGLNLLCHRNLSFKINV